MNAKEIQTRGAMTEYVSARWYRSPEQIFKLSNYSSKIDIFALGCIMAEFYTQDPLFDGISEQEQLSKICQVMGVPDSMDWPEFQSYVDKHKFEISTTNKEFTL